MIPPPFTVPGKLGSPGEKKLISALSSACPNNLFALSPKYISEFTSGFATPNAVRWSITDCGGFSRPKTSGFALNWSFWFTGTIFPFSSGIVSWDTNFPKVLLSNLVNPKAGLLSWETPEIFAVKNPGCSWIGLNVNSVSYVISNSLLMFVCALALCIFEPKAAQVKANGISHLICECITSNIRLTTEIISLI